MLNDIDFVDGNINGELARRSVQKYEKHCATTEILQSYLPREQH